MNAPDVLGTSIARHRSEAPDPLGFDALRELGVDWSQQASGRLWTDYNLHDPGVSLLEALCYAITEDVFAARQSVPRLLGLDEQAGDAAWERFGLSRRALQQPCRPLSERDWQLWLRQQLPQARQLQMRARLDDAGRFQGLWSLSLQDRGETEQDPAGLPQLALKAFWSRRNLAEDLAHPPRALRPRWVGLRQLRIAVTGERELPELLGELLQRCDDCISSRIPDSPEQEQPHAGPDFCDGPLGRPAHADELQWLESRLPTLHPADLARQLAGLPGLLGVEDLDLALLPQERRPAAADEVPLPPGSLQRWGADWALRLRWPELAADLAGWTVLKDGAVMRLELGPLLAQLQEWRRVMYLRRAGSGGTAVSQAHLQRWTGFPAAQELPPLPAPRDDHLPATAALPPLYEQAVQDAAAREPGLRAQWTGYRALLEQGLLQVQVQREQMPRLYALDQAEPRSYWPGLPGESQLPGVESLLQTPRGQLPQGAWIDEDPLARRHRLLDYQLALHGELLDHGMLQGLPCYFSPQAWSAHLLRIKRDFARRLPRLTQERHAGADPSLPLLDEADNTPPLQERLALQLALMSGHSRLLGGALAALQALPAGASSSYELDAAQAASLQPALEAQSRARPLEGGTLAQRLRQLGGLLGRLGGGTDWLRAASSPRRFVRLGEDGPLLLLDEAGPTIPPRQRAWRLAAAPSPEQARSLAHALHELACLVQLHSEGLHLVETLLLRPVGEEHAAPAQALAPLCLVCTGWTARGRDERYRELVQDLLLREAPAHLRCELLWLEAEALQTFEAHWQRWLTLRRQHGQALLAGQDGAELVPALDQSAGQLLQFLAGHRPALSTGQSPS